MVVLLMVPDMPYHSSTAGCRKLLYSTAVLGVANYFGSTHRTGEAWSEVAVNTYEEERCYENTPRYHLQRDIRNVHTYMKDNNIYLTRTKDPGGPVLEPVLATNRQWMFAWTNTPPNRQ